SLSQDSPTMASGDGGPRPDGSQSPDGASAPDAPAGPHVFADPATLDFGTITQGANAMLPITLTNDRSSTTAAIVTHFTATGASGFSLVTDNCNGKMLDPQASCAVTITYAPSSVGPATASEAITVGMQMLNVSITGSAIAPGTIAITPNPVTLASVALGQTS